MTNLIKRLREHEALFPKFKLCRMSGEAADEIERLREELATSGDLANTYRRASNYWWAEYYRARGMRPPSPYSSDKKQDRAITEMVNLQAEVERLREELAVAKRCQSTGVRNKAMNMLLDEIRRLEAELAKRDAEENTETSGS